MVRACVRRWGLALLPVVVIAGLSARARADCPPPIDPEFEWILETPYGEQAAPEVMWGETGIFMYTSWLAEFVPDPPPPLPWDLYPDYHCDGVCFDQQCSDPRPPAPGQPPDCTYHSGWVVANFRENIADENLLDEDDWFMSGGLNVAYNCLAYACGRTDERIWGPDCTGAEDEPDGMYMADILEILGGYGYSPAENCFPECDVRKVALLGGWGYQMQNAIVAAHAMVEIGDGGWWESKFGRQYRVVHRFFDMAGGNGTYGGVIGCVERFEQGSNPATCAPGYDPYSDPANQVPAEICDRWGGQNYLFCRQEFCAESPPEACPADVDPDQDGIVYPLDVCPEAANLHIDTDGDGIDDACDNCIDIPNRDQANCDEEWDTFEPNDRRGDECDPDPCADWNVDFGGRPFQLSVDRFPGHVEEGRFAHFGFRGFGGDMSEAELSQPEKDNYLEDETFQDSRPTYCSCAAMGDCDDLCNENGFFDGDPFSGLGWFAMTRNRAGDDESDPIPDVPYRKGGTGGASWDWVWQTDVCPGPVDCVALADQQFHFWLRPLVAPASWPTGWPEDEHNFYAPGEHRLAVWHLDRPPEEIIWPGPRLIPEGSCFHCDQEFFAAAGLPYIGEFSQAVTLPPNSPYRFAGAGPSDPVQGIALGLVDPDSLAVQRYVPSRGNATNDEPLLTGSMHAVQSIAGSGFDATLWLFGGTSGSGARPSALFRGDMVTGTLPSDDRVVWFRRSPQGLVPPGRVGALLAHDPVHDALVLWGGLAAGDVALDDVWRYDIATNVWTRSALAVPPDETRPGFRAFMATAQRGKVAYAFGGRRTDGTLLEDLYEIDLAAGSARVLWAGGGGTFAMSSEQGAFEPGLTDLCVDPGMQSDEPMPGEVDAELLAMDRVEIEEFASQELDAGEMLLGVELDMTLTSTTGPGPRSAASLAIEPDHRGLLLYGGITSSGPASDLWRFDFQTLTWERLARSCTSGSCAPAGAHSMAAGPEGRTAILIPTIGPETRPEIAWYFDQDRAARSPGWLPETEWAADPAAADCDGNGTPDATAGFACATSSYWYDPPGAKGCTTSGAVSCPQVSGALAGLYSLAGVSPVRIAARGRTLLVASGSTLKRYRLSPGSAPTQTAQVTLNGTALGIVIDGPRAFVATSTSRVQAFSLAGFGLATAGQRVFSSAVGSVGGDGARLYVTAGNKLWVLSSGSPTLPILGSVTLPQSSASALAVVGRRVAVANGSVLAVVSVANPASPVVQGSVSIGTGTTALRAHGERVYGVKSTSTYVVDVSNPASPQNVGTHNVSEWAKGAQWTGRHAIRVSGTTGQVGEREP